MDVPEADELYGLPLRDFVPARDALAKRLRAEGRREDASAVAALRRPSVAAWAVNQLMRTQRRAASELFDAGAALLETQSDVVARRRPAADLRAAAERHRHAIDALRGQAAGLLDERGRGPSAQTLERVGETLHAISLDPDLREEAAAGRLLDAHRFIGLGPPGTMAPVEEAAAPAPEAAPPPRSRKRAATPDREDERRRAAEAAARRKAAEAAERAALEAAAARAAAEQRVDAARAALEEAESALAEARAAEKAATDAAHRARAEAE